MSFVDPNTVQNPTTGIVAPFGWGDSINAAFNWLRNPKVGCYVTSVTATAIGTDTALPWGTETFDVGACHDTVTNTSRITVPTSWGGLWFVGADVAFDANAGTIEQVWIVRNGTTKITGDTGRPNSTAHVQAVSVEEIYVMAAGDYFEVWVTGADARSTAVTSRFYAWWAASGV